MKHKSLVIIFLALVMGGVLSLVFSPFLFSTLLANVGYEEEKVQRDCGELLLSWDSVERADIYSLFRGDELIYKGRLRSYTDRPLDQNTSYRYYLLAENDGGISDFSEQVVITVKRPCPPEIPGDFTVNESACGGDISLEWDSSARAESYELVRQSVPGSTGGLLNWLSSNTVYEGAETSFAEEDLQPGGIYSYRVRAVNESGVSEWNKKQIKSSVICSPEKPSPPTGE